MTTPFSIAASGLTGSLDLEDQSIPAKPKRPISVNSISMETGVDPGSAPDKPVMPNPADVQTPATPAATRGLSQVIPDVSAAPVVLNDASIPAPLTPSPSLKGLGPVTPATPPNQAIIQDAGTGQTLAAGSGPATGGFGMREDLRLAEVARQDAASKAFQRGMDRTRMIDANDAVTRAQNKLSGAQTPLELQQAQAGLTAAQAQLATTAGYDQHMNTNETTMQGHVVTAKEKAAAIKDAAATAGLSKVEAATVLAESRKYAADARGGLTNQEDLLAKRDIAVRLRDAQRGYVAALKSGDPDRVASAVDTIEAMNADAETLGVTKLPVPKRPMTSEQTAALAEQATANLKAKRGLIGRVLDSSPNAAEVQTEVDRMKKSAPAASGLTQPAAAMPTMPPAAQHPGRTVKDTATGKRFQSVNGSWQEVN